MTHGTFISYSPRSRHHGPAAAHAHQPFRYQTLILLLDSNMSRYNLCERELFYLMGALLGKSA